MTIISHQKKLAFIHIQKTGGTSISEGLQKYLSEGERKQCSPSNLYKHMTKKQILQKLPKDEAEKYIFFTVVRHPITLLFSLYNFVRDVCRDHPLHKMCTRMSFDRFVSVICGKDEESKKLGKISNPIVNTLLQHGQHVFFDRETTVIHFENLRHEFQDFCTNVLNIDRVELPHINSSSLISDPSLVPCTQETRNLVYEKFKKDFELLGYTI